MSRPAVCAARRHSPLRDTVYRHAVPSSAQLSPAKTSQHISIAVTRKNKKQGRERASECVREKGGRGGERERERGRESYLCPGGQANKLSRHLLGLTHRTLRCGCPLVLCLFQLFACPPAHSVILRITTHVLATHTHTLSLSLSCARASFLAPSLPPTLPPSLSLCACMCVCVCVRVCVRARACHLPG